MFLTTIPINHHNNNFADIVYVNSEADLPTPVGGVISLENKVYWFSSAAVTITNILEWDLYTEFWFATLNLLQGMRTKTAGGNFRIFAAQFNVVGSNVTVFTSASLETSYLQRLTIFGNQTTTIFNIDSGSPFAALICNIFSIFPYDGVGIASLGTIKHCVFSTGLGYCQYFIQGLTLTELLAFNLNGWQMDTPYPCTYLTFNGTYQGVAQFTGFWPILHNAYQYALNFNASTYYKGVLCANSPVELAGTATQSNLFQPGSKTQTALGFRFSNNNYIPDSTVAIGCHFVGAPYTTIPIPTQNAKTIINAPGWTFDISERMTGNTLGYTTYNGSENISVVVDGNFLICQATGTNAILIVEFILVNSSQGQRTVTFTNATDVVNETATPRANGDLITFTNSSGTLPAAFSKNILYYVVNKTTNTFQLSYTSGGAAILFADNGSGTLAYETVTEHGSEATATVDSNTKPVDIIPQAIIPLKTGDKIYMYCANTSAANDIRIHKGYMRIKK